MLYTCISHANLKYVIYGMLTFNSSIIIHELYIHVCDKPHNKGQYYQGVIE